MDRDVFRSPILCYACKTLMIQMFCAIPYCGPKSKFKCSLPPTFYSTFSEKTSLTVGRSGSVVARLPAARRGPRFESRCGQKFAFSRKSLRYAALGTGCTLTAVPGSTQPSTLRETVNEYQTYGRIIIRGDGRMFGLWQPTGGLKGQVCSLAYELAATWR